MAVDHEAAAPRDPRPRFQPPPQAQLPQRPGRGGIAKQHTARVQPDYMGPRMRRGGPKPHPAFGAPAFQAAPQAGPSQPPAFAQPTANAFPFAPFYDPMVNWGLQFAASNKGKGRMM